MGQVFNNGLDASEKQEGLLKRLKNIEDRTDNQFKENKDNQLGINSIGYTIRQEFSQEAKNMFKKLKNQEKLINYICTLTCMEVIKNTMILENLNL